MSLEYSISDDEESTEVIFTHTDTGQKTTTAMKSKFKRG